MRSPVTGTELLRHKFFAPTPNAGAVRREGILRRIAAHPSARVVLVQGPAGHGKSTALQQIQAVAQAEGARTGWLTFDIGDNDPRRFFLHFQALIASVCPTPDDAGYSADPSREPSALRESDRTIEVLLGLGTRVSLFLDEFQTLSDRNILAFFRSLFERAPDGLQIFVGSRALPDVGLARLVVNGKALILHGDDLRFTPQEVEQFFADSGELDADEIDAIFHRTEGWPAALQLYRLTLSSPHVRRSLGDVNARAPRELAEYLAENVFVLQPPEVQDFLLGTSVLQRLSASLCDAVLDRHDSAELLRFLERSGLFLRCIDPIAGWFKYHTLFSSIVAEQFLQGSPERARDVHRRAARWFAANRHFEDAIHHSIACEDYALAADALNSWSTGLVSDAQLRTVERWATRIPITEFASRPDLTIKCVYALVFLRCRQQVRPLLDLLDTFRNTGQLRDTTDPRVALCMAAVCNDDLPDSLPDIDRMPIPPDECSAFAQFELSAAANLRACLALSRCDFEAAREQLAIARVYNEHIQAAFSRGYTTAVAGLASLLQGSLREALDLYRTALDAESGGLDRSFASATLNSCYIWALYEANDLEAAEAVFTQNRDAISRSTLPDFLTVAYLAMARIHDARGRPVKCDALLDEAEAIGRENGWGRLISTVRWERTRRLLLRGAIDQVAAPDAASTGHLPPQAWIPVANDFSDAELGRIRLALARDELDTAAKRIDAEMKRQRGRVLRQIKLHLLTARHALRAESRSAAHRSLRAALRLAQPGRLIRAVLDEGPEVMALVREEYQRLVDGTGHGGRPSPEQEYIESLLQASGSDLGSSPAAAQATLQPLTEREREMLVLLANGISNKDMATRLYVSENTVKFHLKNIYAKLSVTSRVQATTAARQLGLL